MWYKMLKKSREIVEDMSRFGRMYLADKIIDKVKEMVKSSNRSD